MAIAVKDYIDRRTRNPIIHWLKTHKGSGGMHPRLRPIVGGIILSLSLIPAGMEFYWKQAATAEERSTKESVQHVIQQNKEQNTQDIETALDRAERCILINEQYPLVEGGNAFYDATGRKSKRLLPKGTQLCSADSGFTAEVGPRGKVIDVIPAPVEKIREILKRRGLVR